MIDQEPELDEIADQAEEPEVAQSFLVADEILGDKERLSNGLWVSKNNGEEETLKLCHAILQLTGYSKRDFIITYG